MISQYINYIVLAATVYVGSVVFAWILGNQKAWAEIRIAFRKIETDYNDLLHRKIDGEESLKQLEVRFEEMQTRYIQSRMELLALNSKFTDRDE